MSTRVLRGQGPGKDYTVVYVKGGPSNGFWVATPRTAVVSLMEAANPFIYLDCHDEHQIAVRAADITAIDTHNIGGPLA